MAAWQRFTERDHAEPINPDCASLRLRAPSSGRAFVLLHGITNCPAQWGEFGRRLHSTGSSVLVPRYPRHGLQDRLNAEIAGLTPDELEACANAAVDAAHELSPRVTVIGLSLGAILAGLLAATRADLERAVLIAPLFGVRHLPRAVNPVLRLATRRAPNFWMWWDPREGPNLLPEHGYPRVPSHAFGAMLELGRRVTAGAREAAPAAPVTLVTNANDPGVDNGATRRLGEAWMRRGGDVTSFEFPAALRLPHDLIDPKNPEQRVEVVYPRLLELVGSRGAARPPARRRASTPRR